MIEDQPFPPARRRRRSGTLLLNLVALLVLIALAAASALTLHPEYGRYVHASAWRQPSVVGSQTHASATPKPPGKPWPRHAGLATPRQLHGLVQVRTNLSYESARAEGTGLILASDGVVVTNHHVVAGATTIRVTDMSSGRTYTATMIGADATHDVALIRLEGATGLPVITPSSTPARAGDQITAVGDALGRPRLRASLGHLTSTNTSLTTSSLDGATSEHLTAMLEAAVHVVPGDSGGATYDAYGHVIGMTTAASSDGSTGFAIPIDRVLRIVGDLRRHTTGVDYVYGYPAFLGVQLNADGSTRILEAFPDTPAARAGLGVGDRITWVDGTAVSSSKSLRSAIRSHTPGQTVQITWVDPAGNSHTGAVTLMRGPVA